MLSIVIKEIREVLRDKTTLFFMIAFPIMLVFFLGNLLANLDSSESPIGELKVHYICEDLSVQDNMVISGFIDEINLGEEISFEQSASLSDSDKLVGEDEISAVIVFSGSPMEIKIHEGRSGIQNKTIYAIMTSFVQTNKSISAVINTAPAAIADSLSYEGDLTRQKDFGHNRTMLDYYGICMVVMLTVNSVLTGAYGFLGERQMKTINRLILSPKSRLSLFVQKIFGLQIQSIMQIVIVMSLSALFFNVHYASSIGANLLLFLLLFMGASAFISIGVLLGLLMKANPTAILMPICWVMLFISGSYSKEIYIEGVTDKMPPNIIQSAAFDLTVFGRTTKALTVIAAAAIICLIFLAISAVIFSRKEEER